MARSGSLAAWEQRLAAQRREEDRLARERRQRERDQDKIRQQEHLAAQQRAAEEQTVAVEERMQALGAVLTSVLPLPPLSFERLLAAPRTPEFDPGPLGTPVPPPSHLDEDTGHTAMIERPSSERLAARTKSICPPTTPTCRPPAVSALT